ncbi:twitch domain-containing radical SAM protein [bacterium]|nr:twitch domain-containing radical SAM protein [bacterium]
MDKKKYDELITSPYFCAYPFVQVSTVPAGFMRPCCFYTDILKNDDGSSSNVDKNTFQNIWNNNNFKTIRKDMLDAKKIHGCQQCHKEDSFGGDSMRKRSLREWTWRSDFKAILEDAQKNEGHLSTDIKFLELKPGNLCNLKCRMCNQFDSSKYAAELKEIGARFNTTTETSQARLFDDSSFEYDFNLEKMADWSKNADIWKSFEKILSQVEILSFAGGEPSLIEEVYTSLKFCVDNGYAKNIRVYFASNFTQNLDRFAQLAKHFERFDFIASIDGHGDTQEYIRFPSKWPTIEKNFYLINEYSRNFSSINLMINLTLNLYNILSFTELLNWLEAPRLKHGLKEDPFNLNILMFPEYLSVDLLPNSLRQDVISKVRSYMESSWICKARPHIYSRLEQLNNMLAVRVDETAQDYTKKLTQFWVYTKILDQIRSQKITEFEPPLVAAIENNLKIAGCDLALLAKQYHLQTV